MAARQKAPKKSLTKVLDDFKQQINLFSGNIKTSSKGLVSPIKNLGTAATKVTTILKETSINLKALNKSSKSLITQQDKVKESAKALKNAISALEKKITNISIPNKKITEASEDIAQPKGPGRRARKKVEDVLSEANKKPAVIKAPSPSKEIPIKSDQKIIEGTTGPIANLEFQQRTNEFMQSLDQQLKTPSVLPKQANDFEDVRLAQDAGEKLPFNLTPLAAVVQDLKDVLVAGLPQAPEYYETEKQAPLTPKEKYQDAMRIKELENSLAEKYEIKKPIRPDLITAPNNRDELGHAHKDSWRPLIKMVATLEELEQLKPKESKTVKDMVLPDDLEITWAPGTQPLPTLPAPTNLPPVSPTPPVLKDTPDTTSKTISEKLKVFANKFKEGVDLFIDFLKGKKSMTPPNPVSNNVPPQAPATPPVVNVPPQAPATPPVVNVPPQAPATPPVVNVPPQAPATPPVVNVPAQAPANNNPTQNQLPQSNPFIVDFPKLEDQTPKIIYAISEQPVNPKVPEASKKVKPECPPCPPECPPCPENKGDKEGKDGKDKGKDKDKPKWFDVLSDKLYELSILFDGINKAIYPLVKIINEWDKVQRRALAGNTTLEKTKIPNIPGLDLPDLGMEILELRELGFDKLEQSTYALIGRLKNTDQSTASLRKFLGENSLNLQLNAKQSQGVAATVEKYSLLYGDRQDKALDFLAKVSQNFKTASTLGLGPELSEAFTALRSSLRGRGEDALNKLAGLITNPDLGPSIMLGIQPLVDQLLQSNNVDAQIQLLQQIVDRADQQVKLATGNNMLIKTQGQRGIALGEATLRSFGTDVSFISELKTALQDMKKADPAQQKFTQSLESFQKTVMQPLQEVGKIIEKGAVAFTEFFGSKIVRVIGGVLAGAAVVMAILGVVAAVFAIFAALPAILAGIAPWLLGAGAIGGGIIAALTGTDENTEEINKKTKDENTAKYQITPFESGLLGYIKASTENILGVDNDDTRLLDATNILIEENRQIKKTLQLGSSLPQKPSGVVR